MTRKSSTQLVPAVVLALGILASALIAASASGSLWLVGAGVLLLAASLAGADVLDSWLRRRSLVPSPSVVLVAVALLVACGIVAIRDPESVLMLIPVLGGGSASAVLFKGQPGACDRRGH
jgi:uncharacterized membrane protein